MLLIAFDTSTVHGGVAVLRDELVLSSATWQREGSHGELLTPNIETGLAAAGVTARDLDGIAVGIGPGSFTGVRVAVNAARSLAFAIRKPVFAFDTLEIIAAGCNRRDLPLLVMTNAHKNMVFVSTFTARDGQWHRSVAIQAYDPEKLGELVTAPHLCLGDGFDLYRGSISPEVARLLERDSACADFPQPQELGLLAKNAKPLDWKHVQALYIRESGAEEKLRDGRKN